MNARPLAAMALATPALAGLALAATHHLVPSGEASPLPVLALLATGAVGVLALAWTAARRGDARSASVASSAPAPPAGPIAPPAAPAFPPSLAAPVPVEALPETPIVAPEPPAPVEVAAAPLRRPDPPSGSSDVALEALADLAARAAADLRGTLEPGAGDAAVAAADLAAVLEELADAVAEAGAAGPLPLAAQLSAAVGAVRFGGGVGIRRAGNPGIAHARARSVRLALRCMLRASAAALADGGHLTLRGAREGGEVIVEVADDGVPRAPGLDLLIAARLAAAEGGRLEREVRVGRGAVSRLVLPAEPPIQGV